MADVLTNWVVALRPNLIGVATLRQSFGEPIEFRCGGRIFIFIVVEGRYEVKNDPTVTHLDTGEIYFVHWENGEEPPGPVATVLATTNTAVVICASFAGSPVFLKHLSAAPPVSKIARHDICNDTNFSAILELIGNAFRFENSGRDEISSHLFEALYVLIVRHCSVVSIDGRPLHTRRDDPYVNKAIVKMQQAPGHAWTVDQLASLAGLSRAAFSRRFKADTGDTPLRYLTRCRMHVAADMLRRAATVRTVAENVGYLSEFAFSRAFSSYHGVSPRDFKEQS
ncbi:AraC family transcriptional regulator [Rhizobium sp. NFR03]|uniref:AraC family transcriptional regulator n=1 Tax=Rhizobium sp. NFR03 TaxID=1566263 RepID=UPI0008AB4EB6|nr:AraC family transcriptional regulator [Rhizobium sp. NFR03]SES46778.1 AraC-type DNA-binding protein [Rhizobium sp. NFR03]